MYSQFLSKFRLQYSPFLCQTSENRGEKKSCRAVDGGERTGEEKKWEGRRAKERDCRLSILKICTELAPPPGKKCDIQMGFHSKHQVGQRQTINHLRTSAEFVIAISETNMVTSRVVVILRIFEADKLAGNVIKYISRKDWRTVIINILFKMSEVHVYLPQAVNNIVSRECRISTVLAHSGKKSADFSEFRSMTNSVKNP